jgi:site-specific DNA recombinase
MITAIYARKSTEQNGVAEDQKSVTRQIAHARQYASTKGWTVSDVHVYVDDGVSGAEFANRPGFVRLLNALSPRAPFQALIVSELSRLGREQIETAYALKQLSQAGVSVISYLDGKTVALESPVDKFLLAAVNFAAEVERDKARQRTYDALQRKARAGYVAGGRVFGYDNVAVTTPSGQRSHVERQINGVEAAVVRRIFDLSAEGHGLTAITKRLNAAGELPPRAQRGRPTGWVASSVREVLLRSLYRGEIVWNQTAKRDRWGQRRVQVKPVDARVIVAAPALRIVSDALWNAAHARMADRRAKFDKGNRPTRASRYLLSGFSQCSVCGGGFASQVRQHGRHRVPFYACTTHWKRGSSVCSNNLIGRMELIDAEVLATLEDDIFRPDVIDRALALALEECSPRNARARRDHIEAELGRVEEEARCLADGIGQCGPLDALVDRLRAAQAHRDQLRGQLAAAPAAIDLRGLERAIHAKLADWRGLLKGDVEAGRETLRLLLTGPLQFTPVVDKGRRGYRFTGTITLNRILAGVVDLPPVNAFSSNNADWPEKTCTGVASPTGFEPVFWP